jgi:hypothetical protein
LTSSNLGPDADPQTSGRPLIDYLAEQLAGREAADYLTLLAVGRVKFAELLMGMGLMARAIAQRVEQAFPSKAYAPLLIERGVQPILAQALASLTISRGTRLANESKRLPAAVDAIRFLAKTGHGRRAIARKAEILLAAREETSIIDAIFAGTEFSAPEFLGLLESAATAGEVQMRRITEIAAGLAPVLSIPRGPKIGVASATHELVLDTFDSVMGGRAYTWNPYDEDFSDPLTQAARKEFQDADFDPQPARRRVKARRKAAAKPKPH